MRFSQTETLSHILSIHSLHIQAMKLATDGCNYLVDRKLITNSTAWQSVRYEYSALLFVAIMYLHRNDRDLDPGEVG